VLAGLIVTAFALVGAIIGLTKMVLDSVAGNSAAAAPVGGTRARVRRRHCPGCSRRPRSRTRRWP